MVLNLDRQLSTETCPSALNSKWLLTLKVLHNQVFTSSRSETKHQNKETLWRWYFKNKLIINIHIHSSVINKILTVHALVGNTRGRGMSRWRRQHWVQRLSIQSGQMFCTELPRTKPKHGLAVGGADFQHGCQSVRGPRGRWEERTPVRLAQALVWRGTHCKHIFYIVSECIVIIGCNNKSQFNDPFCSRSNSFFKCIAEAMMPIQLTH